jgi:hypothetical protein
VPGFHGTRTHNAGSGAVLLEAGEILGALLRQAKAPRRRRFVGRNLSWRTRRQMLLFGVQG